MPPRPPLPRAPALATGMLTVVRVPVRDPVSPEELRASTAWYPLVGGAVGAGPALVLLLPFPVLPRAVLALLVWVLVTGALHLDGWADCCDAALCPPGGDPAETRARRLAILKDPHLGTFGVVGVVGLLLGKWTALVHAGPVAPLLAAPLARWAMVYTLHTHRPARADGLGATLAGRLPLGIATLLTSALTLAAIGRSVAPFRAAMAVALGVLAGLAVGRFLAGRFGGVTGDVCGAVGEAVELAVLWALLPWGHA